MYNSANLFNANDLFLVPVFLILAYFIGSIKRRQYIGTPIYRYYFPALFLRLLFTVVYAIILQFYYGRGDTHIYYQGILDIHDAVMGDFSLLKDVFFNTKLDYTHPIMPYLRYDQFGGYTWFVLNNPQNLMVSKAGLLFSFLFAKNYLCISMTVSIFSFAGCWRLFKFFYFLYPSLHKKFAFGILFLPSILFWGVGLSKDSICIGALGFLTYALYKIFVAREKKVASILLLVINGWLLLSIKPYILLSFTLAATIGIFMMVSAAIKNRGTRILASFFFILLALFTGYYMVDSLASLEASTARFTSENLLQTMQNIQSGFETVTKNDSYFKVGDVGNNVSDLILLFPAGVGTTLFRPFIWEVQNPLMLFSALESLLFLVITIMTFRKIGLFKTFGEIFSDPLLLFCFTFSIIFAGLVGITTFNFGALVRYKTPCLPFYICMLFILIEKSGVSLIRRSARQAT